MSTLRISNDIGEALENWCDVPEFVNFRYSYDLKNGKVTVYEYDDAQPGTWVKRYVVELDIREVK